MSDEAKGIMEVANCQKCGSEEIDVVNLLSQEVFVECRECGNIETLFCEEEIG